MELFRTDTVFQEIDSNDPCNTPCCETIVIEKSDTNYVLTIFTILSLQKTEQIYDFPFAASYLRELSSNLSSIYTSPCKVMRHLQRSYDFFLTFNLENNDELLCAMPKQKCFQLLEILLDSCNAKNSALVDILQNGNNFSFPLSYFERFHFKLFLKEQKDKLKHMLDYVRNVFDKLEIFSCNKFLNF